MTMTSRCYYKSLGVAKDAPQEDIKSAFRKLSLATHPDVAPHGCPKQNVERFKEISEAYRILSNAKERRRYDLEMQDRFWYQNQQSHANAGGAYQYGPTYNNLRKGHRKATGFYGVMDRLFHPRNLLMGVALGLGSAMFYQTFLVDQDAKKKLLQQQQHGKQMVEAWRNPTTGRWEQAAPWDPTYQRLKPTLELVPREMVRSRTR